MDPPDFVPTPDLEYLFPVLDPDLKAYDLDVPNLEPPDAPPGVDPLDLELYDVDSTV